MTYKVDLEEAKRRNRQAEHLVEAAHVAFGISGQVALARELLRLSTQVMNGSVEWDVQVFIDSQVDDA